jgi:paraquat-inducible protein A
VTARVVCPDCAAVQALAPEAGRAGAVCFRCGAILRAPERGELRRVAPALALAAVPLLVAANVLPIMRVDGPGGAVQASVLRAVATLHGQHRDLLALLVLLLVAILPAVWLGALAVSLRSHRQPGRSTSPFVTTLVAALAPWSQVEILLFGMLISLHRLAQVFHVVPGAALACMAAFLVLANLASNALPASLHSRGAARDASDTNLARTTALLLAAMAFLIPANLLPVTTTTTLLGAHSDTLAGGVVRLWRGGSPITAALLFLASIVVPVVKIAAMALLVTSSRLRATWWRAGRTRLHRLIHRLGRWSMLDVFVIALVATVLRTYVAGVTVERGALAFAAVVVLSMLASASFDPRVIWRAARAAEVGP